MDAIATEKWRPPLRRRLYLMRHGEVDYFDPQGKPYRPDAVPLNAEGRRQAEAAGRALAAVPLDGVLASGLRRSVETAALATAGRGLAVTHRPQLREIEPGRLADLEAAGPGTVEKAFLAFGAGAVEPATRFLGGETFASLQNRVWPCFQDVLAERSWTHLLLVAHGVVNRVILGRLLGAGLAAVAALEQEAGCLNLIDVDDAGHCLVRLLNFTPTNPLQVGMDTTTMERLYLQYRGHRR
jgi:probable phosphoglycerate mutase